MPSTNFTLAILALIIYCPIIVVGDSDKVVCVPLWEYESADDSELDDLVREFAKVEEISLKQSWLSTPESGFNSTVVNVAWQPKCLYVFARLQDNCIGSQSRHFNQRLWELGDAFEAFIHFKEADTYYEFHVSPNNHVMQLRFGVNLTPAQRRLQLPELFMPNQVVKSKVWVEETQDQWYVLLMIPASALKTSGTFVKGDTFAFSFARYDYAHESKEPVLSSSSDHKELDFHRREDWGTLRLEYRDD